MTKSETDITDIVQPSASQEVPSAIHKEAISGLSDFSDARTAMTSNTANLVDMELDGDPERSEDPQNKNKKKLEIQPTVESNTPIITPEDYARTQEEGRVITEGQPTAPENPTDDNQHAQSEEDSAPLSPLAALGTRVSSERDSRGKLISVTSEALDENINFVFAIDGQLTRTTQSAGLTDATTFGADGSPIHSESSEPDGRRRSKPVSPSDYVQVGRDENGNPIAIASNQNGIKTNIILDSEGFVKTRSIEFQNRAMVTDFNNNGDPTRNSLTLKDQNGKPTERTVIDKDGQFTERLDQSGKVVESERYSEKEKTHTITTTLQNGGTMTVTEDDASKTVELKDKEDNTRMVSVATENGQNIETEFYNEDGSTFSTMETPESLSSMVRHPDGSWESTQKEKSSGLSRRFIGKSEDDPGVEQLEI